MAIWILLSIVATSLVAVLLVAVPLCRAAKRADDDDDAFAGIWAVTGIARPRPPVRGAAVPGGRASGRSAPGGRGGR